MRIKEGVNPEIVKNIARCNFLIITVVYIKEVYISGMEVSQRIQFWYQILLKILFFFFFFRKWQKITFLVKNICDKLRKKFWVKKS